MKRTIESYLPEDRPMALLQARVDAVLIAKVRAIMRSRKFTWTQVIEACLLKFVDEMKSPTRIFHDERAPFLRRKS